MREELGKLRCGMQTYEENITTLARDARDAFEVLIIVRLFSGKGGFYSWPLSTVC
jgi:hypothetical protein